MTNLTTRQATTTGITVTTPHALTVAAEKRAAAEAAKTAAQLVKSSLHTEADIAALSVAAAVAPDNAIRTTQRADHAGQQATNTPAVADQNRLSGAAPKKVTQTIGKKTDVANSTFNVTTASIAACADILAAFNANWCYSINEFLCLYLNDNYLRKHQNIDAELVRTVCADYVKYAKLVDAAVDGFMASELGSETARESERFIFCIAAYWCLFYLPANKIDDWSFQHDVLHVFDPWFGYSLQRFIWALLQLDIDAFSDKLKVRTLKRDEHLDDFLLETVQHTWFQVFDKDFIEQKVLQPLLQNRKRAQAQAAENRLKRSKKRHGTRLRGTTQPKPFKLTQAKPPAIYEIEVVPQLAPARPFPRQLFQQTPAEIGKLSKKREQNHQQSRTLLTKAQQAAPECASPGYMKIKRLAPSPKIVVPFKSKPVPQFYSNNKLTGQPAGDAAVASGDAGSAANKNTPAGGGEEQAAAASADFQRQTNRAYLLRENYKLKQKREGVVRRLNEASDVFIKDIEFERLMNERIEQEQADQVLSSINKRVYALQIFEKSITKANDVVVRKKEISTKMRKERDEVLRRHNRHVLRQREARRAETRALRQQTSEAIEAANAHAVQEKHRQAHAIKEEGDQLKLRCIQAREEEAEKRRQVIGEIKAMRARISHVARAQVELDDTQVPGYGFLTELSLCELRERLQLLKHFYAQELIEKNQRIQAERTADREALCKIQTLITRQRQVERDVKPPAALRQRLAATRNRVEATLKSDAQYVNVVKQLRKAVQGRKKMNKALRKTHPSLVHRSRNRRRIPLNARFQQHSSRRQHILQVKSTTAAANAAAARALD